MTYGIDLSLSPEHTAENMPESWALATAPWGFMLSASLPWVLLIDELNACHVFGGLNSSHSRRTRGLTRCH